LKNGSQIPVDIACAHFEFDAPLAIALEDEYPVSKNSVNDVHRSSIENDDLHAHPEGASKIGLQRCRHNVEGGWRRRLMENGQVDVARSRGLASRDASEQVGSRKVVALSFE
jgi:hypothetical protein